MSYKKKLLSLAIGALAGGGLNAQQSSPQLETAVVEDEGAEAVISSDFVLGIENLEIEMTDTIEDTVRYIPGVQVNDTGNRFGDDGFNIRGLEGDYVAVAVDGVNQGETLNPETFASYGMFGSSRNSVEVENVKAVRITRGPNAVTDGNGAIAGSVAYETKDPSDYLGAGDDTALKFKTGYDGRSNETMVSGAFANRIGNIESLLIYTQREGNETETHGDGADVPGAARGQADPGDIDRYSVLAKLAYNLSGNSQIGVVYEVRDASASYLPLSRQSTNYYDFTASDTNARERRGLFFDAEGVDAILFDNVSAKLDEQELFTHGITRFAYSSFTPNPSDDYLRQEDRAYQQDSVTFALDFEKALDANGLQHNLDYGVLWVEGEMLNERFDVRYGGLTTSSGLRSFTFDQSWVPKTDREQFSLYLRDEVILNDQWTIVGGIRYDETSFEPLVNDLFRDPIGGAVTSSEFDAIVAEFGIGYEIAPGHTLAASAGQGYKAPTLQELYLGTESGTVTDSVTRMEFPDLEEVTNPDLDAEESLNYEVSYEYSADNVRLQLTSFWTTYDNMIEDVQSSNPYSAPVTIRGFNFTTFTPTFEVLTADTFTTPQNVGEIEVNGFEAEGQFFLSDTLNLSFAYSTIEGEHQTSTLNQGAWGYQAGDDLFTAAPDNLVAGANYVAPNGDWGVSGYLVWTDGVDERDDVSFTSINNGAGVVRYPDSWTTLDVMAFYEFNNSLRLTAGVRNLLDENYLRWEVINGVRPGDGGFFSGANGNGWQRFTDPGRSFSVDLSYEF